MIQKYVAIICNPRSGKGKALKVLPLLEKFLTERGALHQTYTHSLPKHLNGFTDLVILGGDGTINHTINHFDHIPVPIGIISCGTGNDIAQLLHGDLSIEEQFERAVYAPPQWVDAGRCNNRLFLNGAGIGFDGWVVKSQLTKKLLSGKAAYYGTVLSLLFFYRESAVTITTNNRTWQTQLFMMSVANGKTYGGGFMVAPRADLTDGLLELITINRIGLFKRLRYLPVIEKGKHLDAALPFVQYEQTTSVTITSDIPLQAHVDGEYMQDTQFQISLLKACFQLRY